MARHLRGTPWSEMSLRIPGAVVAESIRVLYVPTPKAACTTLKRLIAEAAGTYDESALRRITTPNTTPEQAIHEPEVNGFLYFRNLFDAEQREILAAPGWWRVAAVRNPYARAYSAFENNWLLFAGTLRLGLCELYEEIFTDGRLDITATYEHFLRTMAENTGAFFANDHFRPQVPQVGKEFVNYTHFFTVETPGAITHFASELGVRAGRAVTAQRLNEGLGLKYRDVTTAASARLVEQIYREDFAAFGYPHEAFPEALTHRLLSEQECRLVRLVQRMWKRQWEISIAARQLRGFHYGAGQVASRTLERLLQAIGRAPVKPEEGDT